MKGIIYYISKAVEGKSINTSTKIMKEGCHVNLKGVPDNKIIIDFDHRDLPSNGNIGKCDYCCVAEDVNKNFLVVLELKKGGIPSVKHVVKQLQAGANFCQLRTPSNIEVKFTPVLVSGKLSKLERLQLKKKESNITFHRKAYGVERIRCGAMLVQTKAFT